MQGTNRDSLGELLEQQQTLARFGELALKSNDLDEILTEACRLVGSALHTNLAKILELQKDRKTLLVRAGFGWGPGIVGKATIAVGPTSSAGHAISTGEPVVSNEIGRDDRFDHPEFLKRAGVRAAVNTIIIGDDGQPPTACSRSTAELRTGLPRTTFIFCGPTPISSLLLLPACE